MDSDQLGAAFLDIAALVRRSRNPAVCWSRALNRTGIADHELAPVNVQSDCMSVARQLRQLFRAAPVPQEVSFFYFGLFDGLRGSKRVQGYYISGWSGDRPHAALALGGEPLYLPKRRLLDSKLLSTVNHAALRLRPADPKRQVLEYAVTFGAAAILSRFAARLLRINRQIYVGFDSGDFARVAN